MLTMLAFGATAQSQYEPIVTPYFKKDSLSIRSIKPLRPVVKRYDVEEFAIDLGATYDNPFDPQDVSLDAKVTSPKGDSYSVPGFLYRPCDRALKDGKEV